MLSALSWLLRSGQLRHVPETDLGGELVDRLGFGADSDAKVDAAASYTTRI